PGARGSRDQPSHLLPAPGAPRRDHARDRLHERMPAGWSPVTVLALQRQEPGGSAQDGGADGANADGAAVLEVVDRRRRGGYDQEDAAGARHHSATLSGPEASGEAVA